jgi:hypothetical protein
VKTALVVAVLAALVLAAPAAASQTVGREAPQFIPLINCTADDTYMQRALDSGDDAPYTVPSDGVLVQWRTRTGNDGTDPGARLEVWRQVSGDVFSYVGGSAVAQPLTKNTLNVNPARIAVKANDVIAIHTSANHGGPCIYPTTALPGNAYGAVHYTGALAPGDQKSVPVVNSKSRVNVAALLEADADGDAYGDESQDNCIGVANPTQADHDTDGQGNACDLDDDNDGVVDSGDAFPLNASESVDSDRDGKGDNGDSDDDNDGLPDAAEVAKKTNRLDRDSDDDGLLDDKETKTNPAKADSDGDKLPDGLEKGVTKPVADPVGPVLGTDTAKFHKDKDPKSKTDPSKKDSDGDGLKDGKEDKNHDGKRGKKETDPRKADTDGDGVTDSHDKHPTNKNRT